MHDAPAPHLPGRSDSERRQQRLRRLRLTALVMGLALVLLALGAGSVARAADSPAAAAAQPVAAAASPTAAATADPSPSASKTPEPQPLRPAKPGADPVALLVWLFTPIFQGLFIILVGAYRLTGNIGLAIIILTLLIRVVSIPLFRQQIVSQRRMQMLQPELSRIKQLYKGDRTKVSQAQMELYKERGVNPAAGCLPSILQMGLLIPMFYVIRDGLTSFDPTPMLHVALPFLGNLTVVPLTCSSQPVIDAATHVVKPCIDPTVLGINMGVPSVQFGQAGGFGLSILAVISGILQYIQGRMVMPPATADADASASAQRTTLLLLPFMSVAWGGFFPAGLYIYWLVTTIFSIVQQYLIVGWGSMFPLLGWTPAFARDHTPRFPVQMPVMEGTGKSLAATRRRPDDRAASAAATVRPHPQRGRQGRRGRRR